ncbi:MAG: polyprenyl synthetase family protein [Chitinophagales bacterium]
MEYQDYFEYYQSYLGASSFLKKPEKLYQPIEYILGLGGKRIRPVLVLAACDLFDGDITAACPAAHAVEVFHNFTLMHDDIMDAAPLRRGKDSVPKKYGSNLAILSGDTMLIKAYQEIEKLPEKNMVKAFRLFNKTAVEVCEGQMLDMSFENNNDVEENDYLEMIELKTAVLMGCSLKLGGICAQASTEQQKLLYELGINMGMAFQIQDDLLDSFGKDNFGKTIGGDILNDKKTILFIHTLKNASAEDKAQLLSLSGNKKESKAKIKAIKNLFEKYGARSYAQSLKDNYFTKSGEILSAIKSTDSKKNFLESLNQLLIKRVI